MPVALPPALVDAVRAVARRLPGAVAAFDADGTLWRDDVGEAFLKHLVARGLVALPGGRDPYAAYEEMVALDRGRGFAYAAQLQAGVAEAALMKEARALAAAWVPPRLFEATRALLDLCASAGLATVVVSASPIQIVRAAAPLAGVPAERCLGMTVQLDAQGVCTDQLVPPVIYAAGKVEALARARLTPIAVGVGDSIHGDLALLTAAKVPVAVGTPGASALADEAMRRGWTVLAPG